jgi:hypothetical protein
LVFLENLGKGKRNITVARWGLVVLAVLSLVLLGVLQLNHLTFPLHLDLMEGTVLQHYRQLVRGQPIYSDPSPEFVPLAYNALYYVISVPFGWILGNNLIMLRVVSLVGYIGSIFLMFHIVRQQRRSSWWGLLAAGLFAAAYKAMDVYLNTAHSDSWLLLSALLGSYLIARDRSRLWNIIGVFVLVAAFWFKQHGALFTIGGVLFLTWREGRRAADLRTGLWHIAPYWGIAAVFGPGLYIFLGPTLFGSRFHYFTWEVPRSWSSLSISTIIRYGKFAVSNYLVLSVAGGLYVLWTALRQRVKLSIWHVQFVFACLSGFMGALDATSSDNVFIPMGTWIILVGVLALGTLYDSVERIRHYRLHLLAVYISFAILIYDPQSLFVSGQASAAYDDLLTILDNLDGSVYAPDIGQLERDYMLYPAAHWVSLDDMIRGPGLSPPNDPNTRHLLTPLLTPQGSAYILMNDPLPGILFLSFLCESYVLEADFGERFAALNLLPKRFTHGYPRYLYRYDPAAAATSPCT